RREAAEARNQADQLVYTVDKSLMEWGDKVPSDQRSELTSANDELKELLKDQDADANKLRSATEKVMGVFSRVGQAMYQNVPPQGGDQTAGGGEETGTNGASSGEDEVVEGEIVEEGGA